jgi:Ca-activated chloride channel family protein
MDFERDYYAILGISSDADEQAVKRAYRQLARRYHPDTSTEAGSAERFLQIQEAYELLTDPIQREAYDHWRRQHGLDHPNPLLLRVTPSQEIMPSLGENQVLYLLLELAASDEVEARRLPLNLCLVLDRSTSMKGARLQQVKEAARYIVDQMTPQDVLSLVVFSDWAEVILPGQRGIDKVAAKIAINNLQAGGGTELLQGFKLGLQEAERWHSKGVMSHLILLTDGQTYGDDEGCLDLARNAGEEQITLTTIGIGSDWNDQLLDEMAKLSGAQGSSIYIDSSARIAEIFHKRIHDLESTFAYNLILSVHLADKMSLSEVFRVSPQISRLPWSEGHVAVGSLEKQHPQALMLSLLVGSHEPGKHRLLQVEVEGEVPSLGPQPVRVQKEVTTTFDANLHRRSPIPPDIVSAMGKLTIYKMQERAMEEVQSGEIDAAVNRLKTVATRLLDVGEAELARAALLEAGRLAKTGSLSDEGRKKLRYGTRGLTILPKEVRND